VTFCPILILVSVAFFGVKEKRRWYEISGI
jgi:hypothetical protein